MADVPSYESVKQRVIEDLTAAFNSDVAAAFSEYLEEEELETVSEVQNELSQDLAECTLIDFLSDKFSWSDSQKKLCFDTLKVACGLQQVEEPVKLPQDISWEIPSKSECAATLKYFNMQCHQAFKDQNAAHMQIATIGRKQGINLVPLLHDIYSFHKWRYYANDSGYGKPQFCGQSPYLRTFKNGANSKVYQALLVTLNSIETRMTPKFMANSSRKIVDDINAFIAYTLCVATMLQNFVTKTIDCCPLLVCCRFIECIH